MIILSSLVIFALQSLRVMCKEEVVIKRDLLECIKNNRLFEPRDPNKIKYPSDAESHYKDVLEKTKKYRGIKMHEGSGYFGPWIENIFIDTFIEKPLSFFHGMIPLFIQWTDIHVHEFISQGDGKIDQYFKDLYNEMIHHFETFIRDDVLYVTVVQDDQGLTVNLPHRFPNILTLSAGGFGHIPIPLIKGEIPYSTPKFPFQHDVGFYGSTNRVHRGAMLAEISRALRTRGMSFVSSLTDKWVEEVAVTKFNLAPRGYGRSSYRMAEVIQIGRIPVLLYNDVPWIPYDGSNVSVRELGFAGQMGSLTSLVDTLKATSDNEVSHRLARIQAARHLYTYAGLIEQISLFFRDPLGEQGGYLKCVRVPDSALGHKLHGK